ncbi:MAG: CpsB/CapC family capsule biosynthesis tyrosine phosphatase [Bacillota bacterium]|nr:CpsB/CapC family capsule biosynthesis tyrosine phosphatase [Bacillota bacterium]
MIDIHSHVVPGIDDGSDSLATTIEMIKIAQAAGTSKIVATPHYIRGRFENHFSSIIKHVDKLNEQLKQNNLEVEVIYGQEVYLDKYSLDLLKNGVIGCINNSKYMLVEFAMDELPSNAMDILYELKIQGVRPIIAHPERYLFIQKDITAVNEFIENGCYFQINTGSITGIFGKEVQKTANKLIENGICHFIASDAHSARRRCPGLQHALEKTKHIDRVVAKNALKNAENIVNNKDIINVAKVIEKKKKFFFFR